MKALAPGVCPACDDKIVKGQEIHKVGGRWLHVECVDSFVRRRIAGPSEETR